jgi:outer membrane protein TolC
VTAANARFQAERLAQLTEARVLYYEIGFLDTFADLTRTDRETLHHFEELARARYSAGVGLQQDVIKIQAEITMDDTKLLEIARWRVTAVAALNALRNRPDYQEIPQVEIPELSEVKLDAARLRNAATRRPELTAADAEILQAGKRVELARKDSHPDFTVGLTYAWVEPRTDPLSQIFEPEDNGQDVLGLTVGLNLPVWRRKISSGVQENLDARYAREEMRQETLTGILQAVDDLSSRIPLLWSQLRLLESVLVEQSEESLRSVESAYRSGSVNSLDLLDAERVLLEAKTAAARTRADYAAALARLEGAIGAPLQGVTAGGGLEP